MKYLTTTLFLALLFLGVAQATPLLSVQGTVFINGTISIEEVTLREGNPTRNHNSSEHVFTFLAYAQNQLLRSLDQSFSFRWSRGMLDRETFVIHLPAENITHFTVRYNNTIRGMYTIQDLYCAGKCTNCESLAIECEQEIPEPITPPTPPEPTTRSLLADIPIVPMVLFGILLLLIIIGMVRASK